MVDIKEMWGSLGKCDAYILASLGKLVQKTKTIKSNYNPTFGACFEFTLRRPGTLFFSC